MNGTTELTKENVKSDVLEYLISIAGDPELNEQDQAVRYGIDDFDLIDMELFLEQKYLTESTSEDGADLREKDTVSVIIEKVFNFLERSKNNS